MIDPSKKNLLSLDIRVVQPYLSYKRNHAKLRENIMLRKKNFTLIELLVVIAIIAILAGIAVPVYLIAMKKARNAQAKIQIKELQTAITAYKTQYQYLPFFPANAGVYNDVLINEDALNTATADPYNDLISTLRGTNANLNPRRTEFMSRSGTGYVDPWGNSFYVALDLKGDGEINDAAPENTSSKLYGTAVVPSDIAIWSKGADSKHDSSDTDAVNKDNIRSWSK